MAVNYSCWEPTSGVCMVDTWHNTLCRQSGPQDPHIDNLPLREGDHECAVSSSETSVLYLQVPEVCL